MGKSHRDRRWYDEPRMKEVRKGADKFGKHRKNMYKYSRDSLSEDSSDNEDQVVDYDEDIEDYDEDEYDTFRPHK